MRRPLILIVMDGWGIAEGVNGNAVAGGETPVLDRLERIYPSAPLGASGLSVGLPDGQMGNSEVGHLNLGAGRVVYQDYTRINRAIESGEFADNPVLCEAMDRARESGKPLHLMGLLSDGGVHSHLNHLTALLDLAKDRGVDKFFIHAFMDGRDTPPRSGKKYIQLLESQLAKHRTGRIATVTGRFYAMDRDNRWERIREAYLAMTGGGERRASSALEALETAYGEEKGDEFVPPTLIDENGAVREGDGIIFFNFRADRAREITRAFAEKDFSGFKGVDRPDLSTFVCMTEYDSTFGLPLAFPPISLDRTLGEVVSEAGMRQLRIAETEKYAHVTFFFNGGVENSYPGEERMLIPSPKDVRTYDRKPQMSAFEVTDEVVKRMKGGKFDLIVLNYANGDMVGHTGIHDAAVKAVEAVDGCIGKVMKAAKENSYRVLITSDHGNAEQMKDPVTGQPHTAHTSNPVPFILADDEMKGMSLRPDGKLADVAPTILELFGMEKPEQMDGRSLIQPF